MIIKKTNINCFSHLSLAIGNSVHSKIKVFATEVIIYIYIYIYIYIIYMLYIYISYIIYIIYILKWKSFHWKCYLEKSQNFLLWRYSLLIYFSSNTNIYIISHSGKAFTAQQKQCYGGFQPGLGDLGMAYVVIWADPGVIYNGGQNI